MGGDDKKIVCVLCSMDCTVHVCDIVDTKVAYWMMTWKGGIGIEH